MPARILARDETLTIAASGGFMEQPLASRSPLPPLPTASAAQGSGSAAARERPVLLRIPDCSDRIEPARIGDSASEHARAGWMAALVAAAGWLMNVGRRPRAILAGALGVALLLGTVALVAATHQRGMNHAGSDRRGEGIVNPPRIPQNSADVARSYSAADAASVLDEAPAFLRVDVDQARSNQPATIISTRASSPGAAAKTAKDKRSAPGPCAHIEPRIDRVSSQY